MLKSGFYCMIWNRGRYTNLYLPYIIPRIDFYQRIVHAAKMPRPFVLASHRATLQYNVFLLEALFTVFVART